MAEPKKIFNVDDVDLAIGTIGLLGLAAIVVLAWKLAGSTAGTAVAGVFGTAATGIGSLARGRKQPEPTPTPAPLPPEPHPPPGPLREDSDL